MRKKSTREAAILAFFLAPCTRAQNLSPSELRELAAQNEVRREELVNLETEMARAVQWGNGTIFRRIYGEDFVGITPSGQIKDKAGWIAIIENSGVKYTSFLATDVRIRIFQDTAVVTCLWSARGTRDGHPFSRQSRVTQVFIYG